MLAIWKFLLCICIWVQKPAYSLLYIFSNEACPGGTNLPIIISVNGFSLVRHQAIIWTNTGILLIGPLRTNFSEIWIKIQHFSVKQMHLKMSSAKWMSFFLASVCQLTGHWEMWQNLKNMIFKCLIIQNSNFSIPCKLLWGECHRSLLLRNQHY